jgi:hypothetical protein
VHERYSTHASLNSDEKSLSCGGGVIDHVLLPRCVLHRPGLQS